MGRRIRLGLLHFEVPCLGARSYGLARQVIALQVLAWRILAWRGVARPAAFSFAVLIALASLANTPSANAANIDYCVTCKGPDETYRCRVQGSGATQSDALKLYCVVRTAKEGGHASCSAKRAGTGCVGLMKVYQYDGPALPARAAADPRLGQLNERVERDGRAFDEKSGEQPKSLFELGGRAYDASKQGLRNAGSAVGLGASEPKAAAPPLTPAAQTNKPESKNFARRSYNCVMSLFRDCRDNQRHTASQ